MKRLVLLAALSLAAACESGTGVDGIRMRAEVSDTQLRQGDTITVRVLVTNVGSVERLVDASPCVRYYAVRAIPGGEIPVGGQPCIAIFMATRVAPGETVELIDRFDGSVRNDTGDRMLLAPGQYAIVGRVQVVDAGVARSAPVGITLRERPIVAVPAR
jgi:hypothetical protein